MKNSLLVSILFVILLSPILLFSQEVDSLVVKTIKYGKNGLEFKSLDNRHSMQISWRAQMRASYPNNSDPVKASDYDKETASLWVSRARMKVGGHAYTPKLTYYMEYDLPSSRLLDMRLMYSFSRKLTLQIGQGKAIYTRERVISSGKQQTMERSIINREFTIDRQSGISIYGNLGNEGLLNFSYWLAVYTGQGRAVNSNDDIKPMYMTRLQWNFSGKPLAFTGSDLKISEKFQGVLALAGVTNRSSFTRYSSSGGGQVLAMPSGEGVPGQYQINQALIETAGMYRGFSWQQELHWKQINDTENDQITELVGGLIQAGYVINKPTPTFKRQFEVYGRAALYMPRAAVITDPTEYADRGKLPSDLGNVKADYKNEEYVFGVNIFFVGHKFKLTNEVGYFKLHQLDVPVIDGWQFRTQCEITF